MAQMDFKSLSRDMAGRDGIGGSAILLMVLALVGLLGLWASWAELDNVTRGEGRIISSAQNQIVQAAEGGVILRRYVDENAQVKAGDILFEIDPVDANAELNLLSERLAALDIQQQRLRAELSGGAFQLAPDLRARSPLVATSEESLFAARQQALQGQLAVLNQRLTQAGQELGAAKIANQSATATADYLQEEITLVTPLVRDKIAPATRLLELKRQLEQSRGAAAQARTQIDQQIAKQAEIQAQIDNAHADYRLRALEEMAQIIAQKAELAQSQPRLIERVSRTIIRAPMDGIVNQLNFRTLGGYVKAGDVMLEMVPTGTALIIEAKIKPQDISRIRQNDAVRIRLSAYDSAKYGTIDGRVTHISPDAIVDAQAGGQSHYLITVAIEGELILDGATTPVTLIPGMTATVDVLSGKRTVLDYIWQPIARVQELALRD